MTKSTSELVLEIRFGGHGRYYWNFWADFARKIRRVSRI